MDIGLMLGILVLAVGGLVALTLSVRDLRVLLFVAAAMAFTAGMATQTDFKVDVKITWLRVLQVYRSEAYLALGLMVCVLLLPHLGRLSLTKLSAQGVMFLLVQYYAAVVRGFQPPDTPINGIQSIVFASATLGGLLLAMPMILREWNDWYVAVRAFALMGAGYVAASFVQFAINPSQLVAQGRFIGFMGNAAGSGELLAPVSVFATWLLLNDPIKKYKPIWAITAGLGVIFLAWTGTRAMAATFVMGLCIVMYARAGRAILFLPIVGLFAFIAYRITSAAGAGEGLARLGDTTDNRTGVWLAMIQAGVENPIIGVGWYNLPGVEHSFLAGFAAYGILMLVILIGLAIVTTVLVWQLWRLRPWMTPDQKRIADVIIAYNVMFFAGSNFTPYIVLRCDANLTMMMVFAGLMSRMIAKVKEERELAAQAEAYGEAEQHDEPDPEPARA